MNEEILEPIVNEDESNLPINDEHTSLYSGKKFHTLEECENFLDKWSKQQGFRIIKDRVTHEAGVVRRRTLICAHSRTYEPHFTKDTTTKKLNCPFFVNISCPKSRNPNGFVFVNKINEHHNHPLNQAMIEFEDRKKFTPEMMNDIKFMTIHCKFGATSQRKFLEGKFPLHPIYSKDLYAAINKFRPTSKSLSNDAAQISNWLDLKKEMDSRWIVIRGWDNDNTLTYLFWMTPSQVENWTRYSDCVINDVTHKTNRYGMALSLFVGFDNDRHNILLAQALLIDESLDSHVWMFSQLKKSTGVQPLVIITDSDPAVDAAICQIFPLTYPIHCAYHITQNLHKNLRKLINEDYENFLTAFYSCRNSIAEEVFQIKFDYLIRDYPNAKPYLEFLYRTKTYWAHCFTKFKFTGGMIASSRVEFVNACLKRLLHNSNVPLCDLMTEIQRLLDMQDKENEYNYWRLSIPCLRNQTNTNFLFTRVDQCLNQFLTPTILKVHRDEMRQSLYYTANLVEDIRIDQIDELAEISELTDKNSNKISEIDLPQATLKQIIQFVGSHNVKEIWAINVGNSLKIKHYILLLQNGSYICSCLSIIQTGIICRHYFQVMLNTKNAVFHIQFIPSRWYNIGKNGLQEPFLIADKFMQEDQYITYDSKENLCLFNQYNNEFCEERLTVLDQQIIYGKLHGMYKKALNKALKNSSKSEELINLLQEFAEDEDDSQMDQIFEEDTSDKENEENVESSVPILQNPRKKRGKGRPVGTKRFKSSCEVSRTKTKMQRHCKQCEKVGHYQKNCKEKTTK